jgi:hypothetical protein
MKVAMFCTDYNADDNLDVLSKTTNIQIRIADL